MALLFILETQAVWDQKTWTRSSLQRMILYSSQGERIIVHNLSQFIAFKVVIITNLEQKQKSA